MTSVILKVNRNDIIDFESKQEWRHWFWKSTRITSLILKVNRNDVIDFESQQKWRHWFWKSSRMTSLILKVIKNDVIDFESQQEWRHWFWKSARMTSLFWTTFKISFKSKYSWWNIYINAEYIRMETSTSSRSFTCMRGIYVKKHRPNNCLVIVTKRLMRS